MTPLCHSGEGMDDVAGTALGIPGMEADRTSSDSAPALSPLSPTRDSVGIADDAVQRRQQAEHPGCARGVAAIQDDVKMAPASSCHEAGRAPSFAGAMLWRAVTDEATA